MRNLVIVLSKNVAECVLSDLCMEPQNYLPHDLMRETAMKTSRHSQSITAHFIVELFEALPFYNSGYRLLQVTLGCQRFHNQSKNQICIINTKNYIRIFSLFFFCIGQSRYRSDGCVFG